MKDPTESDYRQCFTSDPGQRVLVEILLLAGYFSTDLKTTEDLAVLNFAKVILSKCGLLRGSVMDVHVKSLFAGISMGRIEPKKETQ